LCLICNKRFPIRLFLEPRGVGVYKTGYNIW
jgi:hypothetical protein